MTMPSPKERPDLYDSYDCQEPKNPASKKYWDSVMPEHLKKALEQRAAQHKPKASR